MDTSISTLSSHVVATEQRLALYRFARERYVVQLRGTAPNEEVGRAKRASSIGRFRCVAGRSVNAGTSTNRLHLCTFCCLC
jgi:hypothetical protein